MSEMIDRIADALVIPVRKSAPIYDYDERDFARIAVKAMRDPTEGMLDAGMAHADGLTRAQVWNIWQAMIDQAAGKCLQ